MPSPTASLRVLHLDHTTEHGGAELALRRLLESPERDWEAHLVVPADGELGVFSTVAEHGVAVHRVGRAHAPGATGAGLLSAAGIATDLARQALALRRLPAFRDADVIHANSTRSAVYAALALIGRRTPLVVHLRDRIEPDALGGFGYQAFRRLVARRAGAYIANSRATAATIEDFRRPSQEVASIPSPIGVSRAAAPARGDADPVRVGMVARLDDWKGQAELIRAFAGLDVRAHLTLYGDASFGKERIADDLKALAASLDLDRVDFAGFVDDVSAAIDSLDVCVQYSVRPEPLGQNVLQYLARAKVVIAADEGGPREWVVDGVNGLLVPPRDVAALHASLERVVGDLALRERLALGAYETPDLPTDDAITVAHAEVFERAAGRGPL